MKGYLIAEEGPLAGMTIVFEEEAEKNEWSLGRDPETCDVTLEDPMVSRRHAIMRLTPEGFILENLSTVNPATQNGMVVADPVLLKEGDIVQIGSTFFHFTEKEPPADEPAEQEFPERTEEEESEEDEEEAARLQPSAKMSSELHFGPHPETRWLLKVISGPNSGAEFAMHRGETYLIGKDPNICDVVFQDLSVSRQHARISIDEEENAFIEDLGSRNGVIVNGELIGEKQLLASQDLVALGTTTFLVIDRHEARETIISPAREMPRVPPTEEVLAAKKREEEKRDWKERTLIPKKMLVGAAVFGGVILVSIFGMLTLFKTETVLVAEVDEGAKIEKAMERFPGVKFSFNRPSGKLFLTGHVLTTVDKQEMLYLLKEYSFIEKVDDNVVVDELVWQNMNALLSTNPDWVSVSMYAPEPGRFVLRGYLATIQEAEALDDYIHLNFDYLDRLDMQVVVEKNLQMQIESSLIEKGFTAVNFELSNGEVVLAGRVSEWDESNFDHLVKELKMVPGVRSIKNYVIVSSAESSRVNLSNQYAVTGYSKSDDSDFFVVINGRILGKGDLLDGMLITKVKPKIVLLERDGTDYRINFNIQ